MRRRPHPCPPDDPVTPPQPQPVDRARRFRMVAVIVSYCLLTSTAVVLAAVTGNVASEYETLVDLLVSALMGLATATTLAYIGGSVVDYNGGVGNMIGRRRRYDGGAQG